MTSAAKGSRTCRRHEEEETVIATRPAVLTERTRVYVAAADPVSRAGIASQLRSHHGLDMVEERQVDAEVVALVVADQMDEETAQTIRALKRRGVERVVLIVTRVDDTGLLSALEAGARGVLRRNQATPENLFEAIRAPPGARGRCHRTCWAACSTRSVDSSARS